MSDWGIKISLPQEDVGSTDELGLALTSSLGYPKIDKNKEPGHFVYDTHTFLSDPPLGVTNIVSVAHGYGYTPASITIANLTRTVGGENIRPSYVMLPSLILLSFFGGSDILEAYCDGEFFKIDIVRAPDTATSVPIIDLTGEVLTYKYEIFAENGT